MKNLFIYGTGGIAIVAIEAAQHCTYEIAGFYDDCAPKSKFLGHTVLGGIGERGSLSSPPDGDLLVCLGQNRLRKRIFHSISHNPATVIHNTAVLSQSSYIGAGSMVFQNVTIQAEARVGKSLIANTACSIDHHCNIADFCHVAPHATLCGNVKLEEGVEIGAGAVVLPNLTIGKWSNIGAGAVVCEDIPAYSVAVGVPARVIKQNK